MFVVKESKFAELVNGIFISSMLEIFPEGLPFMSGITVLLKQCLQSIRNLWRFTFYLPLFSLYYENRSVQHFKDTDRVARKEMLYRLDEDKSFSGNIIFSDE